jgi:hypothetical protein
MDDKSLTITFTVDRTADEAFAAITNVRGWWSGEIDGPTDVAPHYECYESCSNAWRFYIATSLRHLIVNGSGQPNPEEGEAA